MVVALNLSTAFRRDISRLWTTSRQVPSLLLTVLYLMVTREVEANLVRLNGTSRPPYITDLIARKRAGTEHGMPHKAGLALHQSEHNRLRSVLEEAHNDSRLPAQPSCLEGVNDLLIRLRLHFDR
jgi:hypothetical protein